MSETYVRAMHDGDLPGAERVRRVVAGTLYGLEDPASFGGDAEVMRCRWGAQDAAAFVAEGPSGLVGVCLALRWGSVARVGPLAVLPSEPPEVLDRLLEACIEAFKGWGVRNATLFGFANDPVPLHRLMRHGFWPGSLVVVASGPTAKPQRDPRIRLYSALSEVEKGPTLLEAHGLLDPILHRLDVEREITSTDEARRGDTILLHERSRLVALAVCHAGPATEAGSGACLVRVAAVRPTPGAPTHYDRLMDALSAYATSRGVDRIVVGTALGRREAYEGLLARGFAPEVLGVSLSWGPPHGLDAPSVYLLDDPR